MPISDELIERALVVAAHPDDIEFGCAGTVAHWVRAGVAVTYLVCTRGEQGGFDETPRGEIPGIREAEQRDAAAAVGVQDVRFLDGYADGDLAVSHQLVRDLVRAIRQVQPQRMLIQSPERNWARLPASHPDHLACGEACIRAIYPAARNRFAYPELADDEGLEPWTVAETWLAADPVSDHHVDVTDTFELKMSALRAHKSQTGHLGGEFDATVRGWLAANGVTAGMPQGQLAEDFRVVSTA